MVRSHDARSNVTRSGVAEPGRPGGAACRYRLMGQSCAHSSSMAFCTGLPSKCGLASSFSKNVRCLCATNAERDGMPVSTYTRSDGVWYHTPTRSFNVRWYTCSAGFRESVSHVSQLYSMLEIRALFHTAFFTAKGASLFFRRKLRNFLA